MRAECENMRKMAQFDNDFQGKYLDAKAGQDQSNNQIARMDREFQDLRREVDTSRMQKDIA
jgi:hypothetical protein